MKNLTCLLIFLALFGTLFAEGNDQLKKEKEAIKKVIQTAYVDGFNEGDISKIESGFHECFILLGPGKANDTWQVPIHNWKESVRQKHEANKYPTPENKIVTIKFDWVDVVEKTAVAKFKFFRGGKLAYTDFLSLYKFPAGWKIVHKVFASHK